MFICSYGHTDKHLDHSKVLLSCYPVTKKDFHHNGTSTELG